MFRGESLSHFSLRNTVYWFTLAFQAGAINAGGFLACGRFVTHTTGFATLFGTDIAKGEIATGVGMLAVPLFFLLGAMISAFYVDRRRILGLPPRYKTVFFLIAFFNLFILIAGLTGQFGVFGEPLALTRDFILLALLCFVSGLQNALISSASGAVVRTTHVTGLTTDLGIGLVRVAFHTHKLSRETEIRATGMRIGIISSFALGGTLAAFIFFSHQYWGFILPTVISILLWIFTLRQLRSTIETDHPTKEPVS
jgi:uncharacterized membrane protein YoaK (UPF0700 family)